MPLQKLQFRPGFNKEGTDYSNEGGWYAGDKVRFRAASPEKIGGWQKLSSRSFLGTCRALLPWFDLSGTGRIGVGTNLKYYVEEGGTYFDITPIRATTAAGDVTFSASTGSSTITVTDSLHGALPNDFVTFSGAASLGGNITAGVLNQQYQIDDVVDSNTYTITARTAGTSISSITVGGQLVYTPVTANASDTGNGGASVVGAYQINTAPDSTALGTGWGAGAWSRGGWSSAASTAAQSSQLSAWTHDTFGEDILLNRRGGPIFVWDTSVGTAARAVDIAGLSGSEIPTAANRIMVSDRDRHVIAFGVIPEGGGDLDPMLIRFSDQESYTVWNTADTTTAGSIRLGSGSEIVSAIETRQQTLVFTDTAIYTLQYLGPPFTFGTQLVSKNTTLIAPTAAVAVDDTVFWMGDNAFYQYDGAVQALPCDVLQYVFNDLDANQAYRVASGANTEFGEVWWFYPTAADPDQTNYVVYNYKQRIWYTGSLTRTAWVDVANGATPVAAGMDGYLYYHETGFNDGSTDPASPINAYIESSPIELGDGEQFAFLSRMIPDINFGASTQATPQVTITTNVRTYPTGGYSKSYDNVITSATDVAYLRLRGRQFSVTVTSNTTNMEWRLGTLRYDIRQDGTR